MIWFLFQRYFDTGHSVRVKSPLVHIYEDQKGVHTIENYIK